ILIVVVGVLSSSSRAFGVVRHTTARVGELELNLEIRQRTVHQVTRPRRLRVEYDNGIYLPNIVPHPYLVPRYVVHEIVVRHIPSWTSVLRIRVPFVDECARHRYFRVRTCRNVREIHIERAALCELLGIYGRLPERLKSFNGLHYKSVECALYVVCNRTCLLVCHLVMSHSNALFVNLSPRCTMYDGIGTEYVGIHASTLTFNETYLAVTAHIGNNLPMRRYDNGAFAVLHVQQIAFLRLHYTLRYAHSE